ncbi:MAG: universal stress protein [Rubrobacteraceae bacterium]
MEAPEPLKLRRILVPVDESRSSVNSLSVAATVARASDSTVILAHVVESFGGAQDEFNMRAMYGHALDNMKQAGEDSLRRMAEAGPFAGLELETRLLFGDPSRALLEAIDKEDVDLVVMGSHGRRAWGSLFMGSVSQHVIHEAKVPVVIVPPRLERAEKAED